MATNKDYLANSQSTGSLTLEAADKLITEKNKAEKEAKLKAEGKPTPTKKPKKKKTLKEVGFDAPPTDEQVLNKNNLHPVDCFSHPERNANPVTE